MLISEVLPQPLGPTMAMNSPSSTDRDTSPVPELREIRDPADSSWRRGRLRVSPEGEFRFALLFGFDSGAVQFLEEAFLHETIDGAVVDDGFEIERLHCGGRLRVRLIDDGFDGSGQDKRHAFERVGFGVQVINAFNLLRIQIIVLHDREVRLHRKGLVFVKALNGFSLRFDNQFRQFGICSERFLCEQVNAGRIDVAVIGEIRKVLKSLCLDFEIRRRCQQAWRRRDRS